MKTIDFRIFFPVVVVMITSCSANPTFDGSNRSTASQNSSSGRSIPVTIFASCENTNSTCSPISRNQKNSLSLGMNVGNVRRIAGLPFRSLSSVGIPNYIWLYQLQDSIGLKTMRLDWNNGVLAAIRIVNDKGADIEPSIHSLPARIQNIKVTSPPNKIEKIRLKMSHDEVSGIMGQPDEVRRGKWIFHASKCFGFSPNSKYHMNFYGKCEVEFGKDSDKVIGWSEGNSSVVAYERYCYEYCN